MRLNYQMGIILEASMNSATTVGVNEVMQCLDISKSAAYLLLQNCQIWLIENKIMDNSMLQRRELCIDQPIRRENLRKKLSFLTAKDFEFSANERKILIILMLIRGKYVSTNTITEHFRISRNTCILDLAKVNETLQLFHLDYTSGNRGYTLSGNQYDIYRLSLWAVSNVLSVLFPGNYDMALSLFDFPADRISELYKRLKEGEKNHHLLINREASYLFCATCILISQRLGFDRNISCQLIPNYHKMKEYSSGISNMIVESGVLELVTGCQNSKEDELVSKAVTESLARMLICVCEETGEDIAAINLKENDLENYALSIIQRYESYIGMIFENQRELKKAVTLSLKCILLRKSYGFCIESSLYMDIKKHYHHLTKLVKEAVEGVPHIGNRITEEDCILFTVNFLGWMYKNKRVTSQTLRILIVCAGNVGTSVLLQGQIEKLLPGAQVLTASLFQNLSKFAEYMDVIISTIPLEVNHIPVIVVNAFLTNHDKLQIKKLTRNKTGEDEDLMKFISDFNIMAKDFIGNDDRYNLCQRIKEYFKINSTKIFYGTGGRPLLKDLVTENRINLVNSVSDWKEAIRLAARPLEEDQSIEPSYVDAMIRSVETMGPYIVLAPGIALPHARPEAGVRVMSMSLLRVKEKVYFTEEKYANLFFVLASSDGSSHLDALRDLSAIFSDETAIDKFMKAETANEIYRIIN